MLCTQASCFFNAKKSVLLLSLLHHFNSSLAYSLKNCTIKYSLNPLADVFVDCGNCGLVTVPVDIPRDVTSATLLNNLLEKINREDFSNLSKLRFLDLHLNKISHVDNGAFIQLGALTSLYMSFNKLTNLTANLFQGLANLTMLDLTYNNIGFIHTSAFQFLTSLLTVILDNNQLQKITDIQPVLELPQILSIIDNRLSLSLSLSLVISSYKMEKFSITTPTFPHLETIDLSHFCRGPVLKWEIPDKSLLKNITRLYFGDVSIHFGDIRNVLQSLDSLRHLTLNNMERWINQGLLATVCKIPTLQRLDLSWSTIINVSAKLVTCSQLSELDLSMTQTIELSKDSIRSMKRLRKLNVEQNLLSKVPDDIRRLSFLETLILSDNYISELGCDDFINTTHLTELYLDSNNITKLDKCVFEHLNYLNVLDVSDNLLSTLGDTFKLGPKMLTFLDLSRNLLPVFEKGDFQGLGSLKYLNVSNNIVRLKDKAFDGLNNLESLRISLLSKWYYSFRELQGLKNLTIIFSGAAHSKHFKQSNLHDFEVCDGLKSLKVFTVIFSGNQCDFPFPALKQTIQSMTHLETFTAFNIYISALDRDTFQFNTQLKNLTIRHTNLSHLDPVLFLPIANLQVLDLSNSELKSLDFLAQAGLSALRCLILKDNHITVINETVFQSLPALTYLDLDNNPFTCDCFNAGFIRWVLNNKQTQAVNAYQYTCSFPVAHQGRKLLDFNYDACLMNISFLFFISSTCLVVGILLSSFTFHFLRWQFAYTFKLFQAFLYDKRNMKKKGAPHQFDAFVSYNVHDEAWVYREMLPVLEGEQGWRLCLHHRDFQPGKPIMENITDAIYDSRKTICVISRHYLQSEWCSREIQMASFRLFDEQKDVLILLFLEEIPTQQLSPYYRMRKTVKRRTYLSWPQAGQHRVFWQNVRRALETGDDSNLLIILI
uniref:TIR domain-containing protein n=1 Tax=Anabas testudineus TaxID=64144 RepID=A0AAQ6IKK7_ANATE